MTNADHLVELYILDTWRAENPDHADCTSLRVINSDASDGTYGCETGCSYYRFTAEIVCEHRDPAEFEFGDFEDIARDYEDADVRPVAEPAAVATWFE